MGIDCGLAAVDDPYDAAGMRFIADENATHENLADRKMTDGQFALVPTSQAVGMPAPCQLHVLQSLEWAGAQRRARH